MDGQAPVTPQDQRGAEGDEREGAGLRHVGEEEHRAAEQQRGKETRPGREKIMAAAVDQGEGQHAGEERQRPYGGFAPADDSSPDGEQQRPAVGLIRVAVCDEAPGYLQRKRPRIEETGRVQ